MDALDDDPTKLEPSNLYALACFKNSLITSDRLDARWASLHKIEARDDYNIDDINANQEAAIEAVVREVHFQGGAKPSVEEMGKMGPLEMLTVVRVLSYIAPMNYRTNAQSRVRAAAMSQSQSDEARNTFLAFVEGRQWNGRDICGSLARREDELWSKYWRRCLELLEKKVKQYDAGTLARSHARFFQLLKSLKTYSPAWACKPAMRAWFEARQCRYQRMMVSTTCHW